MKLTYYAASTVSAAHRLRPSITPEVTKANWIIGWSWVLTPLINEPQNCPVTVIPQALKIGKTRFSYQMQNLVIWANVGPGDVTMGPGDIWVQGGNNPQVLVCNKGCTWETWGGNEAIPGYLHPCLEQHILFFSGAPSSAWTWIEKDGVRRKKSQWKSSEVMGKKKQYPGGKWMIDQGRADTDGTSRLGNGQDIAECWLALAPALVKKRAASDSTAIQKRARITEDGAASVQARPLIEQAGTPAQADIPLEGGPSPQPETIQVQPIRHEPDPDNAPVSLPTT